MMGPAGTNASAAACSGYAYDTQKEAAALVAWQQQVYYQQQLAVAEVLPPKAKQQHMSARALVARAQSRGLPRGLQLRVPSVTESGGNCLCQEGRRQPPMYESCMQ